MQFGTTKFGSKVTKRSWPVKDKVTGRATGKATSTEWYGRMREGNQPWKWVKLFADKRASERRWEDMRRAAEHRASGMVTEDMEVLELPIDVLRDRHITSLRVRCSNADHVKISEGMLNRLVALGKWKNFRDITVASMEAILAKLADDGKTAEYQNKYIARAKAFVSEFLPDGCSHPLRKLKRRNVRAAKRNKARRSATEWDVIRLLQLDIPEDRALAYALAALNGLRRNEARDLTEDRLKLDATYPHIEIVKKMGKDDRRDVIPIHPYVAKLLRQRSEGTAGGKVLRAVPDVATLERDWEALGVPFRDASGRRLDYHALRHTFGTNLDRHGVSRATKKKLTRHANEDVTDGYLHAELDEMTRAIARLQSPDSVSPGIVTQSTAGASASDPALRWTYTEHATPTIGHLPTPLGTNKPRRHKSKNARKTREIDAAGHALARPDLIGAGTGDIVRKTGPDTQVD